MMVTYHLSNKKTFTKTKGMIIVLKMYALIQSVALKVDCFSLGFIFFFIKCYARNFLSSN